MVFQRQQIIPGFFEVYCGCMKSGKTKALIDRIDGIHFREDGDHIFFKPKIDTRDETIHTRFGNLKFECNYIDSQNPSEMLDASNNYKVIAIDEVMFFGEELLKTIDIFRKKGKMILASGLDLDFKAEPFGIMPKILAFADDIIKTHGTCEYKGCSDLANRTQRLINNNPAHYNEPLISIEGSENFESYECRCLDHNYIPGKP